MRSWSKASALLAACGMAGCTTVGPNFKTPDAPTAAGYAMPGDPTPAGPALSPDARAAGPWWRAFGSADLDAVMTQALAGNQSVALVVANVQKAAAQEQSVRGGLAPRLDANAGAARERINFNQFGITFPGVTNPTINLLTVGLNVSYDLDLFGGGRRKVETAEAMTNAQARRADAAYLTLTANVARQAVRIAALRDQEATVREIIVDDQRNIDIVRRAEAEGGEPTSATPGGVVQLAEDQALLPPLDQEIAQARHALAMLVGKSPAEWTAPAFAFQNFTPPATIPVSLPSTLVRRRPDILAAEEDFHADTARIGVATADLYPDIKLSAGIEQSALTPATLFSYDSTGWTLASGLTAPIFNGGALKADKRAAEAQARASLAQYKLTVLTAFVQVSDVMAALANDDERLAADGQAERAAQSSLNDARAAYSLGGGALLPVVYAQRRLNEAKLTLTQARGQKLMDTVDLYAATATDWRDEKAVAPAR
jgi:NodT family efflux transporter outer membrane factor (OMF) lipoprotein